MAVHQPGHAPSIQSYFLHLYRPTGYKTRTKKISVIDVAQYQAVISAYQNKTRVHEECSISRTIKENNIKMSENKQKKETSEGVDFGTRIT